MAADGINTVRRQRCAMLHGRHGGDETLPLSACRRRDIARAIDGDRRLFVKRQIERRDCDRRGVNG